MEEKRHKFRWVVVLYKDGDKITQNEFVRVSRRPPLTISATANESWNHGGKMALTFFRKGVEECDGIWLGVVDGDGAVFEEWELREVKKLPPRLFTSHIPQDDIEYEDDENETFEFSFNNMSYRCNKTVFNNDNVGKWTNYSTLHMR